MTARTVGRRPPPSPLGLVPIGGVAARAVLANRSSLVFTGGFYLLVTGVISSLWAAAAESGAVAGYSATALTWYVATTEAAVLAQPPRLVERMGDDIASGRFEVELLRPVAPLWVRLALETGSLAPRLAVCVGLGVAYAWLMAGPPPGGGGLVLAAPALVLAAVANLVNQHLFASAAFWLREARSAGFLYQKLIFVLGGMLLPLEVLPDRVETVARWLPFAAMAYAPGRLASGHWEPALLLVQVAWLVVLTGAAHRVARAGEQRFLRVAT